MVGESELVEDGEVGVQRGVGGACQTGSEDRISSSVMNSH